MLLLYSAKFQLLSCQRGHVYYTTTTGYQFCFEELTKSPAIAEKSHRTAVHCLWNSRAACWRWLFQIWKFCWFVCSQWFYSIRPPWPQRERLWFKGDLRAQGRCRGWKIKNSVHRRALSIDFCCRMYRLATMHSVTDKRTGRQTDDIIMPIADHTACSRIG